MEPIDPKKSELISEIAGVIGHAAESRTNEPGNKWSFLASLALRIIGLVFGGVLGVHYFSHNDADSHSLTYEFSSRHLEFYFYTLLLILVPISGFWLINKLVKSANRDRYLSIDAILSNLYRIFLKPVFTYMMWTLLLFMFQAIGHTWLPGLISGLIFGSTVDMKFNDQRHAFRAWREASSGT